MNGHAGVVGGLLVAKDPAVARRLRDAMVTTGCDMDPHHAFLVLRGLKTSGIRVGQALAEV